MGRAGTSVAAEVPEVATAPCEKVGPAIFPVWHPLKLFWAVEDGNLHPSIPASASRVDMWIRANVHIEGRPDWVFVKVHGHAASSDQDVEETLGANFDQALSHLESRYNDGVRYRLHYVTAREAYNLVCAVADGRSGSPEQYYDCRIPPYSANRMQP